jgi:hypothetical protein
MLQTDLMLQTVQIHYSLQTDQTDLMDLMDLRDLPL